MARISWWPFDEASSGTAPTAAADGDASPVNLTITYTGTAAWTSIGAGNGLNINANAGAFAKASVSGNKLANIAGLSQLTLTIVLDWSPSGNHFYGFEQPGMADVFFIYIQDGALLLSADGASGSGFTWGTCDASAVSAAVRTLTVVLDTPNATQNNRCRWFIDGSQVSSSSSAVQNSTITAPTFADVVLTLGNAADGTAPFSGGIYAATLYDTALTDTQIATEAAALLADNDADPPISGGGGGAAPGYSFRTHHSRSLLGVGFQRYGALWVPPEMRA